MTWFSQQKEFDDLIAKGDLCLAVERFDRLARLPEFGAASLLQCRQRLTAALLDRANALMATDKLLEAWSDVTHARKLSLKTDPALIESHTQQLIDITVEHAEAQLYAGRAKHALQLIAEMERRGIEDWRIEQIVKSAGWLNEAEQLASAGKFSRATERLETLREIQPEIEILDSRIKSLRKRNKRLSELSKQLQSAALECRWIEVSELCDLILALAPCHEIAIAAKKHAHQQMKRRTNAGSQITNVPETPKSDSFYQTEPKAKVTQQGGGDSDNESADPNNQPKPPVPENTDSFLAWVDGVGGFLICIRPECMIGQAIEGTTVDIPLQADVRIRHARIELIGGRHMVQPLGEVAVDEQMQDSAFVLRDGQVLSLGHGVKLTYSQSHPYSKTSRLDFTSRHRTRPWSDAVLLASQSVILGPSRHNHVYCPRWKDDLIFFCRKDQWYCRSHQPIFVDNARYESEAPIQFNSHISGADFSLTLEPVIREKLQSTESA